MDEMQVLHWLPEEDRWEIVAWDDFRKFRGMDEWGRRSAQVGLHNVNGGVHHFVVCVYDYGDVPGDNELVFLHNLIPHKYLINPDGSIGADNFCGETKEERAVLRDLMFKSEWSEHERQRYNEIQERHYPAVLPPRVSAPALLRMLRHRTYPRSAAEHFLRTLLRP
jgi:hypothetical protein